ncbi:MAG: glucosamine-6-phosphate deaminase [Planctomycetes bacterium]|nr:glucosamine-6-phosphate deaminase [Planctomycetota bacterium]
MIKTTILDTPEAMGKAAAETAIEKIAGAIDQTGYASIILATGASQFEVLDHLVKTDRIDWSRVTMFHLDEYVGMTETHNASFRKYLKARFINQVSPLKAVHLIDGDAQDPSDECRRLSDIISRHEIAVTLAGIGENGHLAFNDPPADFETTEPYLVVDLDARCRQQQRGEGWFSTLDDVPTQAISMGIRQIMKTQCLILSVPDTRKAEAVKNTVTQAVSPEYPASMVQTHGNCHLYLDRASAALLESTEL